MRNINDIQYRYELKYVCSHLQMAELEQRIGSILTRDPHVGPSGFYTIRSLYFDDYYNSAFWDKENGTDNRKKYRVRVYDSNMDHMCLEIKGKMKDKTTKEKTLISQEQYQELVSPSWGYPSPAGSSFSDPSPAGSPFSDPSPGRFGSSPQGKKVLNQMLIQKALRLLQPVIIVEYDRMPFIAAEGNVRITLDRDIRSSARTEAFADPDLAMRGVMPDGEHLLEIKFDEFLPDVIYRALNLENMTRTSFSKYYLCRKFN